MQNKNYNLRKSEILRLLMGYNRFQIGCVIVEYDLFNTTTFIQNLAYARFGIILTQLYINFSRQEHKIDVLSFKT